MVHTYEPLCGAAAPGSAISLLCVEGAPMQLWFRAFLTGLHAFEHQRLTDLITLGMTPWCSAMLCRTLPMPMV
jgi:hypothetical protein